MAQILLVWFWLLLEFGNVRTVNMVWWSFAGIHHYYIITRWYGNGSCFAPGRLAFWHDYKSYRLFTLWFLSFLSSHDDWVYKV